MSGPLPEISAEQRQTLDQVREQWRERVEERDRESASKSCSSNDAALSHSLSQREHTAPCTLCVGVANDKTNNIIECWQATPL